MTRLRDRVLGSVGALTALTALTLMVGCATPPPSADSAPAPTDAQHQGITAPHGDHSAHHGGLVLMNGDVHYEVVLDKAGQHRIWFSDAVREDLPASQAAKVTMVLLRKGAPDETLLLAIDDNGESWQASGQAVAGEVTVKVSYVLRGEPFEIEIPFAMQ